MRFHRFFDIILDLIVEIQIRIKNQELSSGGFSLIFFGNYMFLEYALLFPPQLSELFKPFPFFGKLDSAKRLFLYYPLFLFWHMELELTRRDERA